MPAIIIDNKYINKSKFDIPQKGDCKSGLIVLISQETLKTLKNIPYGEKRVEYFNSERFISQIEERYYIFYDSSRKKVYIDPIVYINFTDVLNALFTTFPKTCTICVVVPLQNSQFTQVIRQFTRNGFANPEIKDKNICLSRVNCPSQFGECETTLNLIIDMLEQSKNDTCGINIQFTDSAIRFLKKTSKIGFSINKNGEKSQKELSGELYVEKIIKKDNKYIYLVKVDEGSVGSGSEEEVNVSPTRYNFHSHPEEAYVRHSVELAWPSLTDYLGYLTLGNRTIFHCVATLEGVYIMSFGKYWVKDLRNVSKKFIKDNYNINHKEKYSPLEYVEKVNSILFQKHPIYHLQFISWDKLENNVFSINYAKTGDVCISK